MAEIDLLSPDAQGVYRLCLSCDRRWPRRFFRWWSRKCRACRHDGPAFARQIHAVCSFMNPTPKP